jgi:thiamine biosynthesis lipoprotein
MYLFKRLAFKISIVSLSILLFTGCEVAPTYKNEIKISGKTMGTFYNITVVGDYPGGAEQLKYEAEAVLDHLNKELSAFDKNSTISKFNNSQSIEPMEVSQTVVDIIIPTLRVSNMINGATDITVGPLVNAWGFGPDKFKKIPTDKQIAQLKQRVGLDKLHILLNYDKAFLRKDIPDLRIDLGTVGEGFGADKLAELMDSKGISNYMVSIAGAIRTKGVNSRGTDWLVAIEDPSSEQVVGKFTNHPVCTKGQAISTSGSYRIFIKDKDGKRKPHIIDPSTGKPIDHNTVSVTVIGPTALWTDALDTGLMVLGSKKALEFANDRNIAIYTIEKTEDGFKSHSSRAMEKYLKCE